MRNIARKMKILFKVIHIENCATLLDSSLIWCNRYLRVVRCKLSITTSEDQQKDGNSSFLQLWTTQNTISRLLWALPKSAFGAPCVKQELSDPKGKKRDFIYFTLLLKHGWSTVKYFIPEVSLFPPWSDQTLSESEMKPT